MFGEQDHSVGFEKGVGKKAENVGIDKISVMELPESAQTLISWLNKEMPKDLVGKVSYMEEGLSEDKKREFNFMFRQAERDVIELRGLTGAVFFAEQMPLSEEGIYALLERYFWSYTVEHFREIGLFLGHLRGMGMDKEEVRWLMEDMIDCFVAEQLSLIGRVSFMASLEGEEKENVDDKLVYEAVLRALDNRDLIEREFALDRADLIGYLKKGWIYKAMRQRRDFGISAKEDIQRFDFRVITETGVDYLDFKAV